MQQRIPLIASRTAHRISLVAGILILALFGLGPLLPTPPRCGNLPDHYEPIIAFEMARSVDDLHAIFGTNADECRSAIAAQMNTINTIDCALYIPIYGSFLIFFLVGAARANRRAAKIAVIIVVTACAADYVENACLFKLASDPDHTLPWLTPLMIFTEIKWVGLGLAGAVGGYLLAKRGGIWRLALLPCSMGLLASLASIFNPASVGPSLSLAFMAGWIVFLAVDAVESFKATPGLSPG